MRTMFVNPTVRRKTTRKASSLTISRPAPRKRRRNAGITSFVANPLTLPNPRKRRRKANPFGGKMTLQKAIGNTLANLGGAGIAVGADYFAMSKIQNVWGRNGARAGAALLAGAFLPGTLGAATAGAMFFPIMSEIAGKLMGAGSAVTEADLDLLGRDLGAMLNEEDLKSW